MSVTMNAPAGLSDTQLREVLLGRDTNLPRSLAIRLLPRSKLPDKVELLGRLLASEAEPARARVLATYTLLAMRPAGLERLLVDASAKAEDERVLGALATCLGHVGSAGTLAAVDRIRRRTSGAAAARAGFAAALLAHRLDLAGHELPGHGELPLQDMPADGVHDVPVGPAGRDEAAAAIDALGAEPFDVGLSASAMYEARGRRDRWMVALDEQHAKGGAPLLRRRKTLLGVLARKHAEDGRYVTAFLILTAPAGRAGFDIKLHRVDGPQAFIGRAQADADAMRFSIRSVVRPGVFPLAVEGRLEPDGLTVESVRAGERVSERRVPGSDRER